MSETPARKATAGHRLAVLDFDGVVCDSLPECLAVSQEAYFGLYLGLEPPWPENRDGFRGLRPFVRTGGDYLYVQMCLDEGIPVRVQSDFDEVLRSRSHLAEGFHSLFYRARRRLSQALPERWLALNPLYPGMDGILRWLSGDEGAYILSTKEKGFISAILAANAIAWQDDRIVCSGKRGKLDIIDELIDTTGSECAVFVDDQPDHFTGLPRHDIRCLLADWGYVQPGWTDEYETVSPATLERALASTDCDDETLVVGHAVRTST